LTDLKNNQDEAQSLFEIEMKLKIPNFSSTKITMEFNMAEVVADAVQILKNTALEMLVLNNPDGIQELMEMPMIERTEIVAELLVPNGDLTSTETLNQLLETLEQEQSKGLIGGDFIIHAQQRLKNAMYQLEPEILIDKILIN
jgi:hypothetical protein